MMHGTKKKTQKAGFARGISRAVDFPGSAPRLRSVALDRYLISRDWQWVGRDMADAAQQEAKQLELLGTKE